VSALPYPKHVERRYRRLPGICDFNDIGQPNSTVHHSLKISFTTCRYLCDVELRNPCIGFSFFRQKDSAASIVTDSDRAPFSCLLLRTLCQPSIHSSTIEGSTYFKLKWLQLGRKFTARSCYDVCDIIVQICSIFHSLQLYFSQFRNPGIRLVQFRDWKSHIFLRNHYSFHIVV
jgi:hypothetical protein